jgi:hypothetical protein
MDLTAIILIGIVLMLPALTGILEDLTQKGDKK